MKLARLLVAVFVSAVTELGGFTGTEVVVTGPPAPGEVVTVALVKSVASPNPAAIGF